MARITHDFPHSLERESARDLVKNAWKHYENLYSKYHPKCEWKSPDFVEIGFRAGFLKLAGDLEITDSEFRLGMQVPATLRFLKGKALAILGAEVNKWLNKSKEVSHKSND